MKNKLLVTFTLMFTWSNFTNAQVKEYDAKNFKMIQVENPKGEISFIAKNNNKVKINVEKIKFDPKCKMTFSEDGTKIKVVIDQENMLFDKANCVTKILIEAPKELGVKISTGNSITKVDGFNSAIDFKSATGSFKGLNLQSHFSGTTATGAINLKYSKCPERADIDILTASSDAEIQFPVPCKIKVSHKSAAGELYNEIGESSDYKIMINVKSASGNLRILKLVK